MTCRAVQLGAILVLLVFLFFDLSYVYQDEIYTNQELQYWLQVLSGNWSRGDQPHSLNRFGYATSVFIALILNLGNFVAIVALLYKAKSFLNLRERIMRLADITRARDLAIQLALISILPESQGELVNEAFAIGDANWHRNTVKIHGPQVERTIREILERTDIPLNPNASPD